MNKKGFTLIELMVAIAIISILSVTIIGSFGDSRAKRELLTRYPESCVTTYTTIVGMPACTILGNAIFENSLKTYCNTTKLDETANAYIQSHRPVAR